jgi:hypothetical protein
MALMSIWKSNICVLAGLICRELGAMSFGDTWASCKMIFLPKLFVMLKILSSEYQLYACGKIFRMPRFWDENLHFVKGAPVTKNLLDKLRSLN